MPQPLSAPGACRYETLQTVGSCLAGNGLAMLNLVMLNLAMKLELKSKLKLIKVKVKVKAKEAQKTLLSTV